LSLVVVVSVIKASPLMLYSEVTAACWRS